MGIEQSVAVDASQARQRRIGLTGGIASGKSLVGQILEQRHGVPVLDADRFAREALAVGQPATQAVLDRYGPQVQQQLVDGVEPLLDRAALGRIVFNDPTERTWLEQLVHPLVRARFETELRRLHSAPTVVLMIPLLFEAGLEGLCSEIWLIDCDQTQQLERLMARNSLSAADARARISAQWPLARKRALATVVLDNRGAPEALDEQVDAALSPSAFD